MNSLSELNTHLFRELDRLSDPKLKGEDLQGEIARASAISDIAKTAITSANTTLQAIKFKTEYGSAKISLPEVLEDGNARRK